MMNMAVDSFLVDESGSVLSEDKSPSIYNPLDALIGEYEITKSRIENVACLMQQDKNAVRHFLQGNKNSGVASFNVDSLFNENGAIRSLNAEYWTKAIALTKTRDVFSAKMRNEWDKKINDMDTPAFERDVVKSTLMGLMFNREQFFAEKVDGVYRNLSRHHATNSRFGFTDRMIMEYCLDRYDYLSHDKMNYVSDLRACIGQLRNEEGVSSFTTYSDVNRIVDAGQFGKWFEFDGGAFRLRIYKKGTIHIEIHPDMSWQLNKSLAMLHPAAIPSDLREPPKRKFKEFTLEHDVIGMDVRSELNSLIGRHSKFEDHCISLSAFNSLHRDSVLQTKVDAILTYLGGVKSIQNHQWSFDFKVGPVLAEIVRTGTIPNSVSFQYYPTPDELAERVNAMAEIEPHHTVLEPSVGMGSLVKRLENKDNVTCVDVSMTHCFVVKQMGFENVINGDFLAMQELGKFDRVLMNPPFSGNRHNAHLQHAYSLLAPGGILVAVLPAIVHNKQVIDGAVCEYEFVGDAGFAGTKVNVTLLKVTKPN